MYCTCQTRDGFTGLGAEEGAIFHDKAEKVLDIIIYTLSITVVQVL